MKTEIFDSDPFSGHKTTLLASLQTDYRFEKGDEFFIEGKGKFRVTYVRLNVAGATFSREVLVLRL